jgi:uncharacterized NAD-dependent epimerase/dehydratase family protein
VTDRAWLILADGHLTARNAKTAHGVIRYSRDRLAAVLDRDNAGRDISDLMPELNRSAPVVGSVTEGLAHQPTSLLLGVATPGGWIPEEWRPWILEAIENGLEIVSGLHTFLNDDIDLVAAAEKHGARLWDVRQPPDHIPLFTGKSLEIPQRTVLTVGSDCAVGKKTTAIEVATAGHDRGVATEFVATGQTGVLIAGKGMAVDRVVSDFVSGAAEMLVCDAEPDSQVLIVEGQGSLWHPAYAGVTLGLLHGSAPEILIFCHEAGRDAIEEPPYSSLPPVEEMIATYEEMTTPVRPARVVCISLNCKRLDPNESRAAIDELESRTGLPVGSVWMGDAPKLWDAVSAALA